MMKMASWPNCERFQIKANWKRQKFLRRRSLFLFGSQPALPLGVHPNHGVNGVPLAKRVSASPALRGTNGVRVSTSPAPRGTNGVPLAKKGLNQPCPTGCIWCEGLNQPGSTGCKWYEGLDQPGPLRFKWRKGFN
jgi:hypothetical protein